MTKKEIRQWLAGFFTRPTNKWEAYSRAWDRFNLIAFQSLLWVVAFLTNNWLGLLGLYLIGLAAFIWLYLYIAKGR